MNTERWKKARKRCQITTKTRKMTRKTCKMATKRHKSTRKRCKMTRDTKWPQRLTKSPQKLVKWLQSDATWPQTVAKGSSRHVKWLERLTKRLQRDAKCSCVFYSHFVSLPLVLLHCRRDVGPFTWAGLQSAPPLHSKVASGVRGHTLSVSVIGCVIKPSCTVAPALRLIYSTLCSLRSERCNLLPSSNKVLLTNSSCQCGTGAARSSQ